MNDMEGRHHGLTLSTILASVPVGLKRKHTTPVRTDDIQAKL